MDSDDISIPKVEFNAALWKRFYNGKIRNVYPLSKYNDIIEKIKTMEESPPCNTPGEYYLLRKFIVLNINGKERLACKPKNENNLTRSINSLDNGRNDETKFYVALEEIYKYLNDAHKWVRHGCRDRLLRKIQSQGIVNITRDTVELFLSFCKLCRPGKNSLFQSEVQKTVLNTQAEEDSIAISAMLNRCKESIAPILSPSAAKLTLDVNKNAPTRPVYSFTRGFVDLIDYSFAPDGNYRHVFLYMDVRTCLCALYPVRCKCSQEIVSHLLNVFTLLGPPQVLHSNFDQNFLCTIIHDLKQGLPNLVLVSGSSNYFEVQEVARKCISEVNSMLKSWMFENNSSNWSYGLKLVQFNKNTKIPNNSEKSSYESFFGRTVDSNFLTFHPNVLKSIDKEEQLLKLINEQDSERMLSQPSQPCEHLQVSVDPDICGLVQNNQHESNQSLESENEQNIPPVIKAEPFSDSDNPDTSQFSDSSNDICSSPNRIIKQELKDS